MKKDGGVQQKAGQYFTWILETFWEWKHSNIKNEQTGSFQKLKQMWKKVDDRKTKALNTWNQKYEKTWEIQKEIQKRWW